MSDGWSPLEVDATVADYFAMLEAELRGERYNKTAHRTALRALLADRSDTAIERKHMNISAVLRDIGHPGIDGYKPLGNYQRLLFEAVTDRLALSESLEHFVEQDAVEPATVPAVDNVLSIWEAPPEPDASSRIVKEHSVGYRPGRGVRRDYLALEAANESLGRAGEALVLEFESRRLRAEGAKHLADRIEHVSAAQGDGLGFDILSFDATGRERLIEVKTTSFGKRTPFFVTRGELACSQARADEYHIYRLFAFRRAPKLFGLAGAVDVTCQLDPTIFAAQAR